MRCILLLWVAFYKKYWFIKLLFHGFLVPLPKFSKSIGIKRNQDMKKELKGKELKKFYEDHVDEVAFEMEEAFLNVLHRRGP